jgi:hypothetical protein
MMDALFVARVVLSFLVAGLWIAVVTLLAERLGSRLGGLFSNLPSNILISLIFIAISKDIPFVTGMMPAVPVGLLIDTVFLLVMILFMKYGLAACMAASLSSWLLLAWIAGMIPSPRLGLSTGIYFAGSLVLYLVAEKGMRILPVPGSGKQYTLLQIATRAGLAGTIVASVVLISHFLPPYLTGIISTFPAVLLSTMVILYVNQGKEFARSTGKILILSSSNIVVYAVAVNYTFPAFGIAAGTVISFLVAFGWIILLRPLTGYLEKTTV